VKIFKAVVAAHCVVEWQQWM